MVKKAICPVCGASVRRTNLRRHMLKAHPGRTGREVRHQSFLRRYAVHLLVVSIAVVVSLALGYVLEFRKVPVAVFETNLGTFEVELDVERAPITAGNFMNLTESGFYDGLTFHRVAKDFVIQGGDPAGDGSGGSEQNVPWENTGLKNERYTIAMARAGDPNDPGSADTATSQFFINLKDNQDLDEYAYPFVVFGRVVKGSDVVDTIGSLYPPDPPQDGTPTERVEMKVTIRSRLRLSMRG